MEKRNKDRFKRFVHLKEKRKMRMLKSGKQDSLIGFSLFGLVGWSVVIPTLLGLCLGIWIDKNYPGQYSWTLMLLIIGVFLGCLQAWYWVQKERRRIEEEKEEEKNGKS